MKGITRRKGMRGGYPCLKNKRITVGDVLRFVLRGYGLKDISKDWVISKKEFTTAIMYAIGCVDKEIK